MEQEDYAPLMILMHKPSVMWVRFVSTSHVYRYRIVLVVYAHNAVFPTGVSKILVVLFLCLLFGPLFACVSTPHPLRGHITGVIYLSLL